MKLSVILAGTAAALLMTSAGGALAAGSDYTFVPAGDIGANQYGIESTPFTQRPDGAWGNYSAPGGSGTFEVINGATTPDTRFWFETVHVTDGTIYNLTAILADNYAISAPVIEFTVNGVAQGSSVTLGAPYGTNTTDGSPGPWGPAGFEYKANTTGLVTFALVDTNLDGNGNDFSFAGASVPEPATWAMMLVGVGAMGATLRRRRTSAAVATA